MKLAPNVLKHLLDLLFERYPNSIPTKPTTEIELSRLIGQQDVIRFIEELLERNEN
jgi:hypothetical protein